MVLNGLELPKAEVVSMVTGRLIDELIMRSNREGEFRHYYDIAIIGYSGDRVYSLLGEKLDFLPITELATRKVPRMVYALNYHTLKDGDTTFSEEVSRWVEPIAQGSTPMCRMLYKVTELVAKWCSRKENRESFPPLVFNVTDGESSDGDYDMLRCAARRLQETGTEDGNTLLVNVHLSSNTDYEPVLFPNRYEVPSAIPYAHLLMDMSSTLPESLNPYAYECRPRFSKPPYVAMSYNASVSELVAMLNIGTRSLNAGL